MPWIQTVAPGEATGRLGRLYEAAIERAGRVFGIVRMMSLEPRVLDASMGLYGAVMHGQGGLTRRQRELIAVVTSAENHCHY